MNLTVKQLRVFNRLHRKYPVSLEFLDYNIERILKFMKYSLSLHFICRNKVIQRKFRIFIRYNVPKKNIYYLKSNQNHKKNQNKKYHNKIKKLQALPWTQRVVFYLKKKRLLEKIKQNNGCIEDETNFDLKSLTPTYTDENSLSNSQSIIDIDINSTTPEKLKSNFKLQNIPEVNHNDNEDNLTNFGKIENGRDFFCERTGIFKTFSELIAEEQKSVHDEVEINDETIDTVSNSDSEQPTSEIGYNILSSEQIEEQLKTQLELLKCGKRSLSLLSEKSSDNFKKSVETPKEKNESNLKLSDLLNNKRLSGENYKLIEEAEELSEDTESADIVILKTSDIDNQLSDEMNENQNCKKDKESVSRVITECATIDSFEISEKDAMEAGPSSKESPTFAKGNQKVKKKENIGNLSKDIVNETNNYTQITGLKPDKLFSEIQNVDPQKKSTNIVDSLISKLGSNLESNDRDVKDKEKITIKTVEQINNSSSNDMTDVAKTLVKVQDDNSSSSDDFFGFSASEIIPPQIPGMLPTPAVPAFSSISAFISKDDKHSTLKNFKYKYLPRQCEDGLVRTGYPPPKFEMAALPEEMSKPRTLAEKRIIFSKQRNFKYFMIENENTIFHELKRRARDGRINTSFVRSVQRSRVPASRDLWRATCWLLTENGKYYFQTVEIDGISYKILSGLGNFELKNLPSQCTSPLIKKNLKRLDKCADNCADKVAWQTIRVRYKNPTMKTHISQLKKLKLFREECRPGPLCFKKRYYKDVEGCFNQLEIYKMPKIELEIYPKLNQPLDDYIKSYLKMILPSSSITKEWAEFAVSTLVEKANQYNDKNVDVKNDKEKVIKTKNSFKFTIPYLNDQTHILVRRVLTRSENFDNKDNLTFRNVLNDKDDKISLECANVLSDMIDSVAIGLSENSFIQNDPDIIYSTSNSISLNPSKDVDSSANRKDILKEEENVEKEKENSINLELDKKNNKKARNPKAKLMAELKRLNATIINASDAKVSKVKICEKEYCRLGCVCVSLGANYVPKKHCKKVKCMLEKCTCPLTLIEAGNSVITSEDAFILRQKATARLARMEREFTSTVVLTGNETLLINENQTKRKRRNNARLSNYYFKGDDEESKSLHSARSKNATPTNSNTTLPPDCLPNDEELKENKSPVKVAKLPIDISNICYVNEDVMKSLKHCTVDLNRLENFDDKVIWCMVHCLYKCFCNGKDTEGKPYILKKQEEERVGEIYTRKAKYSFDKSEDENSLLEPPIKQIKLDENLRNDTKNLVRTFSPFNEINLKTFKISKSQKETNEVVTPEQKHKESRIISAYIYNDFYGCHRVQPVPNVYKIRNKREEIKNHWRKFNETEKTKLLLDERIRLSESYVRKVIVKRPPGNSHQLNNDVNNISNSKSSKNETAINKITIPAKQLENISETHLTNLTSNNTSKQISLIKPEIRAKLKLTSPAVSPKTTTKQFTKLEQLPSVTFDLNTNSSNSLFKISSVFSLNDNQNITLDKDFVLENETNEIDEKNKQEFEQSDKNKSVLTSSFLQQSTSTSAQSHQFVLAAEQVQREVMKRLNFSVTKTMHNISKIQSDETANIPNPQPEMMIAVQWKHFLQYYIKDKIHIWQVKVDKTIYFVGTMKHIMPYVVNAVGVINIKAIRRDNLPLFAQMLNAKFSNIQTFSLSVLMEGHRDFWRILGMTKSNHVGARVGVIRPTTDSHPKLTPKINKLFNILTQQYIENLKRRNGTVQQNIPTSITSLQHANKKIKLDDVGSRSNSNQVKKSTSNPNMLSNPQTMVVINNYNLKNNEQLQSKNSGVAILNNTNTNKINIQKPKEFKMNIKIKKFTKEEAMAEHFQVPITSNTGDHRWLVLDLEDDFTHIIFGNSMESLSLNKIKLALQRSQLEKKMVRFPQVDGHLVDCYIMKFDKKRIYLGPFHETIDPVIILYQNVDGKTLIVREDYEIFRGITRQKHTTGFWLCRKNGKIMFDMDPWGLDMNENSLKQINQKNMQQLYKNKKIASSDSNKNISNENQNSIIKLIPENMQLIQSQCNNLSVSNLNSKNNIYESDLEKNTPSPISSKNSTDLANVQQQIIQEVNKIVKKPCIITSITESSSSNIKATNPNNGSTASLKPIDNTTEGSNILKDPLLITSPTLGKEQEKTIFLSKTTNDFGIFSSNVQNKKNELTVKSQKFSKAGDTLTTLATTGPTVGTINTLQSPIPTVTTMSYPTSTLRPIVYGPHMQTPKRTSLPNISSSKKKISPIQIRSPYSQPWSPGLLSKNAESSPNVIRNSNPNLLKSSVKESPGKSKIIGKYNQVIISKTTEKKGVENKQTEIFSSPKYTEKLLNITNEKTKSELNGPVTAEVEEQGGQLILKLPEKFQHKFISQQFIVSKNENGKLILEPSINLPTSVTEMPKSGNESAEKSSHSNEVSPTNVRKQLNKNQNLSVLRSLSTPGILTTSFPTSTIPVLSTVLSTDQKIKSKMGANNTKNIDNNHNKTIVSVSLENNLINPLFSTTQKSGILTLKNKDTIENLTNNGFPSLVPKGSKCNTGITNLSNFNDKGTISKPTLKQQFTSFTQQSTSKITSKIEESIGKKLPNRTNTSEEKNSSPEQIKNELVKNNITTETIKNQSVIKASLNINKSNQNLNNTLNQSTEKINVINEISKNIPTENLKALTKSSENPTSSLYSELPQPGVTKKPLPTYPNALLSLPSSSKSKDIRKIYTAKKISLSSTNNSKPNKDSSTGVQVIYKISSNSNKQSLNPIKKKVVTSNERTMLPSTDFQIKGFIAGYFISNIKNYPKFGGFKKGNEYLIKTNLKSVLQLPSIVEVSKHLNSFIRKQSSQCLVDGKWQFIPFKGQSVLTNSIKSKKIAQDPLKTSIKLENKTQEKKSSFNVSIEDKGVIVIDDDDDENEEKSDNK